MIIRHKTCLGAASALAATLLLVPATPASAADLGGDCCADLEERIAELEATTARKGNRKVSMTVTGWVTNQIMYWDDGHESNVYIVDQLPDLANRFSFLGSAQITSTTKAGYHLTVYLDTTDAFLVDQNNDDAGTGIGLVHSYWYLEDTRLGKLSVGFLQHASDNTTFDIDRSGTIFPSNQVLFDGSSMVLRPKGGTGNGYSNGAVWRDFVFCESLQLGISVDCSGDRRNAVRYDTPSLGGLVLSTSWGEDDFWDVKGVYNKDIAGFLIGLSASYTMANDFPDGPADLFQAGLFVKHVESGVFALAAYNDEESKIAGRPDGTSYYVKAGVGRKINTLGTTYLYGEVGQGFDQYGGRADGSSLCSAFFGVGGSISNACGSATDANIKLTDSEFTRWGVILQQDIDAAAMTLWAKYYNYSLEADFRDVTTGVGGTQEFEDLDMVTVGAAIFF